ncbi:spore morphogenesis/germination protein YwcE [Metabacillus fastidiosus]|uniref:spore morphogenesis/germination protein YwcE n=1 Tax=Metabacillus fastidiosus TaxID=1458 RepID=UPI003D2CB30E
MTGFFAYLLIVTTTPLFLWNEKRTLAIMHIPVVIGLWGVLIAYMNYDLGAFGHWLFGIAFIANVIIAHLTLIHVFIRPFFKEQKKRSFRVVE